MDDTDFSELIKKAINKWAGMANDITQPGARQKPQRSKPQMKHG
jgi:hypothetical protein